MDAWLKCDNPNYTRFGKSFPIYEKKIDMYRYFGTSDKKRVEYIASELEKDKKVFFKRHKGG